MKKMKNFFIVLLCLIIGVGKVWGQLPIPGTTNGADWNNTSIFVEKGGGSTMALGGNTIKILNTYHPCCTWSKYDSYFIVALDNKEYSVPAYLNVSLDKTTGGSWLTYTIQECDTKNGTYTDLVRESNNGNSPFSKNNLPLKKSTKFIKIWAEKSGTNASELWVTSINVTKSITTNTSSLDFGNVVLGDYTEKSVTVTWAANISGTSLTLNSDNPDFTFYNTSGLQITKIPVMSGAAGSASIKIRYTPTAIGNLSANIQVRDASYTQNATQLSVAGKGTLAAPTGLTVGPMSYISVPLSWSSGSSADGYWLAVINKSTNLAAFDRHIGDVTSKDLGDILDHGVTYLWKVRSEKDGVYSDYSTTQEFTTPNMIPVPTAATNLTETSLTANWNEVPSFGGVSISDYEITLYKSSDNSVVKTERTTALSHTFTGLTRGTNYYYTVSAYVTGGVMSQPSSRVNVMTAVYLPIAVNQSTGVNYEWLVKNNVNTTWRASESSGYELQSSSASIIVKFNDIPLSANIKLYRTRNTQTCYSAFPKMYIETSTDGSIWRDIEFLPQENPGTSNPNKTNEYVNLAISADVRQLRIRREPATGSCAGIGLTDGWAFLRELVINPVTITALPATDVLANSFTANWQSVTGATDYAVSVYQKDSEGGNTTIVADWDKKLVGSVSSVNVSGLNTYQTYYYQVNAVFPGGQTQPSNEIEMTPMAIPFRTTAVELNSISLAWDDVSADAYDLLVTTGSEVVYNVTVPGTQTQYNVENLLTGTPYTISITAQFGSQQSGPTELTVTTKSPQDLPQQVTIDTPPTIAETLRHNMTLSSVTLSGGLATDGGHIVEGSFRFKDPTMVLQRGEGVALVVVFDPVNTEYLLPTEFSIEVTVLKGLQTIVWSDKESLSELKVDDSMMKLTATTTSGLAVNYQSSNTDIAEIVDGYLVIKSAGNVTLTVEQQGNDDFEAAESISQSIVVKSVNNGGGGEDNDSDNDSTTSVGKPLHLNLYPNPVNSTLFISGIDIESVELLTIQGQQLLLQQFGQPKSETTVDIDMLPAGIYFVKIFSESQTAVRTITVRR